MTPRLHATLFAFLCCAAGGPLPAAEPQNLLPHGDFEPARDYVPGQGWNFGGRESQVQKGATTEIVHFSETPAGPLINRWLSLTASAIGTTVVDTIFALPPGTRRVRVSGRFRVDRIQCAPEPNWAAAFIGGGVLDAEKKQLVTIPSPFRFKEPTAGWVKREGVIQLPEGAAFLKIQPGLYHSSGDFALDDLVFEALPPQ